MSIKQNKFIPFSSTTKHPPFLQKRTHKHTVDIFNLNWKPLAHMKMKRSEAHKFQHSDLQLWHAAHTALCEHVIRRNDAQSHHIPSLSSHIKNLPSQLHSSPNSHGHLSNSMLLIWTAGPFKVSPSWQGKCLFFKLGEKEVFLSIHITGTDSTWPALLFCGSKFCRVSTYSEGFLCVCVFFLI